MKTQIPFTNAGVGLTAHVKQVKGTMKTEHILEISLVPKIVLEVLYPIPIKLALASVQTPSSKMKPNPNEFRSDVRPQTTRTESNAMARQFHRI